MKGKVNGLERKGGGGREERQIRLNNDRRVEGGQNRRKDSALLDGK